MEDDVSKRRDPESMDCNTIISELQKDPASEKAILSCSKQAQTPAFAFNFASKGGIKLLLKSLLVNMGRTPKANVLRALTVLLEDKAAKKIFHLSSEAITKEVIVCLVNLTLSDSVLSVARALHVLAVFTEPEFANKAILTQAFEAVAVESGRGKSLSFLRTAFAGFALMDANIHGLALSSHLLDMDSSMLHQMEEAQVLKAIFPLCENEGLTEHISRFQTCMVRCWKERAATTVTTDVPEHMQLLERLWSHGTGGGKPFPGKSSHEWRSLGFQGDSPLSDFRGMGTLGLEQLVFFVETCTTEARMVFSVQNEASSECYYPVATAGVIVSSVVLGAVEHRVVTQRNMCPVVLSDGLNRLWVSVFRHFDTIFVERNLEYLQFGELTKIVTRQLQEVLTQNPLSADEVSSMLKALEDENPSFPSQKKKHRQKARSAQWMQNNGPVRKEKDKPGSPPEGGFALGLGVPPSHSVVPRDGVNSGGPGVGGAASSVSVSLSSTPTASTTSSIPSSASSSSSASSTTPSLSISSSSTSSSVSTPQKMSKTPRGPVRGPKKATGKQLRKAAQHGDARKVIELLGTGEGYALVNDPDSETRATALHLACWNGREDCARLLCGAGAALESVAHNMGTPLHCAAHCGNVRIVQMLLEQGAKINSQHGPDGRTPLAVAAAAQRAEVCMHLLHAGADQNIVDVEGLTAGDLWTGSSQGEVGRLLATSRKKRVSVSMQPHVQLLPPLPSTTSALPTVHVSGFAALPLNLNNNTSVTPGSSYPSSPRGGPSSPSMENDIRALYKENAELKAIVAVLAESVKVLERKIETLESKIGK